jgi:hypothetical protein
MMIYVVLGAIIILLRPDRLPYVVLLVAILIEQELFAGNSLNVVGPLVSAGAGFYYNNALGTLPLVTVFSILIVLRCSGHISASATKVPALLVLALGVWTVALAWFQGDSANVALVSSRHVLTLLAGILSAGLLKNATSASWPSFRQLLYCAVILKAAFGAIALATGQAPLNPGGGPRVAFYDSIPLLVAVATLIVAALDEESNLVLRNAALFGSLLLAGVSLRRASLVGAVLVLIVVVLLARRGSASVRLVAIFMTAATLALTLFPTLLEGAGRSIAEAASGVFGGQTADASTAGHLRDNQVGLHLAQQHFFEGVGVNAGPTGDFVVREGNLLYVHNEFLFAWLHYGVVGLLLLVALICYSIRQSLLVLLRVGVAAPWAVFGASVLLAALPGYWFFPHLLTLDRFGLLIGWSLGVVSLESARLRADLVNGQSAVDLSRSRR